MVEKISAHSFVSRTEFTGPVRHLLSRLTSILNRLLLDEELLNKENFTLTQKLIEKNLEAEIGSLKSQGSLNLAVAALRIAALAGAVLGTAILTLPANPALPANPQGLGTLSFQKNDLLTRSVEILKSFFAKVAPEYLPKASDALGEGALFFDKRYQGRITEAGSEVRKLEMLMQILREAASKSRSAAEELSRSYAAVANLETEGTRIR